MSRLWSVVLGVLGICAIAVAGFMYWVGQQVVERGGHPGAGGGSAILGTLLLGIFCVVQSIRRSRTGSAP